MTTSIGPPGPDIESEHFPIAPRYHPVNRAARAIYDFLASSKLAMALLVVILVCCVTGVTVFSAERAWVLIFSTIWFNAILVLLVINIACCFFGRIWGRRITLVSFGMILFHLSFVAMLGGVVFNSMFYFRGMIRLTEGETLSSEDPASYDQLDAGRFFHFERLKGETTLVRMHREYLVDNIDKKGAYEIEVGESALKKKGIIYVTHSLEHGGFSYFNDREGYSLLIKLYDKLGNELYGAHVPLQSLEQKDKTYFYVSGTKEGPGRFLFPQDSLQPLYTIQAAYFPTPLKDRAGEAALTVWPFAGMAQAEEEDFIADEREEIGAKIEVGEYYLSVTEVRYWVGMMVRYEPGQPIVLTSLWVGLGGMIITFIGRMRKKSN